MCNGHHWSPRIPDYPGTFDGPALTLRRARTMIKVMRKAGAPDERLEPRGYGAQYPLSRDDTPAARARNERGSIAVEGG